MSSNLQKFSFAATFSILSMIVVSSIFILTNQYYYNFNNFNNSKSKMGNNDKVGEMLSSFVGSHNLYKNKIVLHHRILHHRYLMVTLVPPYRYCRIHLLKRRLDLIPWSILLGSCVVIVGKMVLLGQDVMIRT